MFFQAHLNDKTITGEPGNQIRGSRAAYLIQSRVIVLESMRLVNHQIIPWYPAKYLSIFQN